MDFNSDSILFTIILIPYRRIQINSEFVEIIVQKQIIYYKPESCLNNKN